MPALPGFRRLRVLLRGGVPPRPTADAHAPSRFFCLGELGKKNGAEAYNAEPIRRRTVVPIRRPAVLRVVVPTAAAIHPDRTSVWACRIARWRLRVTVPPVRTPFPNVPVHVVQAPCVRLLLTHCVGRRTRIIVVPRHFVEVSSIRARRTRSTRIFPLRLRRKGNV